MLRRRAGGRCAAMIRLICVLSFVLRILIQDAFASALGAGLDAALDENPKIYVDLGPWQGASTRSAFELRRDHLTFGPQDVDAGWSLRLRALDHEQRTLSAIFSRSSGESYIQELSLDPDRQDVERQIATTLVNWIDAVLANEHRPATANELEAQREKERRISNPSSEAVATAQDPTPAASKGGQELAGGPKQTKTAGRAPNQSKRTRTRAERGPAPRARKKQRTPGSWTFISPTRWELGLGVGLDSSLQGGPWRPGWSWLYLDGVWTPKQSTRLLLRARWQGHALDQEFLHRVRVELGPEWLASKKRLGIPFGLSLSVERWWANKELRAADGLARIVSLGVQAHVGFSWRLLETRSGIVSTGLQTQLRYSSEIPGWVVPSVSLQRNGPALVVGGLELGLLWTLRWGSVKGR